MKIKTLVCVLALSCLHLAAQTTIKEPITGTDTDTDTIAQGEGVWLIKKPDSAYLKVGDIVPDITLYSIADSSKKEQLSELGSSLTILDFWATYCTPCIRAFPKLDSLQKSFGGKVEIIRTISNGDPQWASRTLSVQQRFEKLSQNPINLRSVYLDFPTTAMFFYQVTVPHYIWLDKNRKIIAITDAEAVTKENIGALLAGKKIELDVKPASLRIWGDKPLQRYAAFLPK